MFDSFLASLRDGMSTADMGVARIAASLFASVLAALYLFFIYRLACRRGAYSKEFNRSCALMSILTCGVILAMQSSLIISLGMVGALSIIRFRNAVKSPTDMLFLFWSFAAGIVCGTGLYQIALLMSLLMTAGVFLFDLIPVGREPLLLIVSGDRPGLGEALAPVLKARARAARVRSRAVSEAGTELIVELRTRDEAALLADVLALPGVKSASLVAHNGDLRG